MTSNGPQETLMKSHLKWSLLDIYVTFEVNLAKYSLKLPQISFNLGKYSLKLPQISFNLAVI